MCSKLFCTRKSDDSMKETIDNKPDYQMLGIGLILAMTFYILGVVVGKIVPAVHSYAWMIILVALSKAFGFIPEKFEKAAQQWSQFVMRTGRAPCWSASASP